MGKLVSEYWTLQVRDYPVKKIHRLSFRVVVPGDLLLEKANQKGLQIEILGQEAEFFQDELGSAQALNVFVLGHALLQIRHHLFAAGQAALHAVLDFERGVFAGKVEDGIDVAEKLLGLLRSDLGLGWRLTIFDGSAGLIRFWRAGLRSRARR